MRGNPQQICSDNATTFIKASEELKNGIEKLRTNNSFRDALLLLHLDWRFIPPSSPHFGGSWESLVKVIEKAFFRVIVSRTLTHGTLSTFVCAVAGMMSGRPLTQVSSDFRDVEPITSNHSMLVRPSPNFPPRIFMDKSLTISSSWKQAQQISDQFWNRFLNEHMPILLNRGKWSTPSPKLAAWRFGLGTRRFYTTWVMAKGKSRQSVSGSDEVVRSCRLKMT